MRKRPPSTPAGLPLDIDADQPAADSEFKRIKDLLRGAVQEHQRQSGESQEDIGVRMGYERARARGMVSYILSPKNNPTLKTLVKLAAAINKHIPDLLSAEKPPDRVDVSEIMKSVRDALRRAVKQSGLTYEEIALLMGLQRRAGSVQLLRILSPNSRVDPQLSTLIRLASALKLSLSELLDPQTSS